MIMINNLLFVKKLKFYQWSYDFFNNVTSFKVQDSLNGVDTSCLYAKLNDALFWSIADANIDQKFLKYYDRKPISYYFFRTPDFTWNYHLADSVYFFNKNHLNDLSVTKLDLIYSSFRHVFEMWYLFPEVISELKNHYPFLNMLFDEREFSYIDSWIKVLPVFEDLLGHLLIEDKPLIEKIKKILAEDIKFKKVLERENANNNNGS